MSDLKPCPFCCSDEISHGWQSPPEQGVVQCHACGAAILADDEDEAIQRWNTRPDKHSPASSLSGPNWRAHVGSLLAVIEYMTEATGEGPDDEDAAMVAQINAEYEASNA